MRRIDPAAIVIGAGVCAALHVGKLPPALPVLHDAIGVSLVQAGFLLSLVQLAGMTLGLLVGLAADGWGLKRSMAGGLLLLSVASMLGGSARDAPTLLALRAVEGFGVLLATMPAPGLIRLLVPAQRLNAMLGWWGAYMPLGTSIALLCGPLAIAWAGWPGWWRGLGMLSLLMAAWLWLALPSDGARRPLATGSKQPTADGWRERLRRTLSSRGPWLVASSFTVYSGQWLAVIGFLPLLYAQAGVAAGLAGVLTSLAAAVNMVGNVVSGRLLQRGVSARRLLGIGFCAMGLGSFVAFAPWPSLTPELVGASFALRYLGVLMFSMLGGMVPGTLFSLAVTLAPGANTVSTTVGWMQQCSALGQFASPPLVALVASRAGGWHWTWVVTGALAVLGLLVARMMPVRAHA